MPVTDTPADPLASPSDRSVRVHLWAAARAAGGTAALDVPAGTLADVLAAVQAACPPALGEVLPRCSYLVDEATVHGDHAAVVVAAGSRVDVLPPFAGG